MRHPWGRGRLSSVVLVAAMAGLAACDTWFGGAEDDILPGERIAVLLGTDAPEADPRLADLDVRVPQPIVNAVWPQQGGTAAHSFDHLALADSPRERWRADAGGGVGDDRWLLSGPVIADGRIFAMDTDARVTAFDAATGARIWRAELEGADEGDGNWGGGVAYAAYYLVLSSLVLLLSAFALNIELLARGEPSSVARLFFQSFWAPGLWSEIIGAR